MAWLILEGAQTALNTAHVVEFSVTGREIDCSVTATLTTGKPRMIRRCKSFAEAEVMLARLVGVISVRDGDASLRIDGTEVRML